MTAFADNLRLLMARQGLSLGELADRSGLDERTLGGLLHGTSRRPHARTLHQLAAGIGVDVAALFENSVSQLRRSFDRDTNPTVEEVIATHPELFYGWAQSDFDELYSRFGTGGELSFDGAVRSVQAMNQNRRVHEQVAILLESAESEVLAGIVDLLYRKVVIAAPATTNGMLQPSGCP